MISDMVTQVAEGQFFSCFMLTRQEWSRSHHHVSVKLTPESRATWGHDDTMPGDIARDIAKWQGMKQNLHRLGQDKGMSPSVFFLRVAHVRWRGYSSTVTVSLVFHAAEDLKGQRIGDSARRQARQGRRQGSEVSRAVVAITPEDCQVE